MNCESISKQTISYIQDKVKEAGAKGVVVGLSGGIDSAVVLALCKEAFPENSLGVIMPCHSNEEDRADSILLVDKFQLKIKEIDLSDSYDALLRAAGGQESANKLALANIKPRLRMTALYYEAAVHNYLVVGTGNKSEIVIGYYTKYGDGGVDIEPIGSLVKSEVIELAKYLKVPEKIIEKTPTAGLWDNQTDEQEMGFTYQELDEYILTGKTNEEAMQKIERLHRISEHKRNMPPILELHK